MTLGSNPRGTPLTRLALLLSSLAVIALGCRARPAEERAHPRAANSVTTQPSAPPSAASETQAAPERSAQQRVPSAAPPADLLRFVTLTTGGKRDDEPLPWVIAMHGLGDTPEAFARLFDGASFTAHVYVLQAPTSYGSGFDWFGVRVSGDPVRLSQAMRAAAGRVVQLIDHLGQNPQNRGKPVVTGFSQGGMLSYALAVLHPDRIALAAPVGGWLPPPLWPKRLPPGQAAKIAAFHGEQDRAVPFEQSRIAAEKLTTLGFPLELHTYPNLGHSMNRELLRDWDEALRAALE
jgi:phospholipase/carboxylesterase